MILATISIANFLTITDSIGKGHSLLATNIGTTATAGTAAYGAQQNLTRVLGLNDVQQEMDLLGAANQQVGALQKGATRFVFAPMIQRLLDHVGGSFDTFLVANSAQVAPEFRDCAGSDKVKAANVFPPVIDPICTYAVSGSGAGARTAGTPIDTTQYGAAQLEVVTTSLIGAASITATLTCKLFDGTTTTQSVTIPNGTASGTAIAVGTGANVFVDCTAISITGGTAADAFKVRNKLLRTIAL